MVRRLGRAAAILTFVGGCTPILLSACTAPTHPTNQPADPPPANLQTRKLAHLQQAAYNYNRYQTLALRQVYPERSRRTQDRPPDDLLGRKRLAAVYAAWRPAPTTGALCRWRRQLNVGYSSES